MVGLLVFKTGQPQANHSELVTWTQAVRPDSQALQSRLTFLATCQAPRWVRMAGACVKSQPLQASSEPGENPGSQATPTAAGGRETGIALQLCLGFRLCPKSSCQVELAPVIDQQASLHSPGAGRGGRGPPPVSRLHQGTVCEARDLPVSLLQLSPHRPRAVPAQDTRWVGCVG